MQKCCFSNLVKLLLQIAIATNMDVKEFFVDLLQQ